ncbi:MAG: tetratricopeptide repeat protein, partial [Okeania sp. SIO2H7]|nr:tetratricopeptide repeat protein [Okeania sp. SIO2H7]
MFAHHKLGDALFKLERYREAVKAYSRAIELNPDFAWGYYKLGDVLVKLQDWKRAVEVYRQLMQIQPDFSHEVEEKLNQALHQQVKVRLNQALSHYLQAIKNDPMDVESYKKALEIKPDGPDLYFRLGNDSVAKGEVEKANEAFLQVIEILPEKYESIHQLIRKINEKKTNKKPEVKADENSNVSMQENIEKSQPISADSHDFDWPEISAEEWQNYYNHGNKLQLEGKLEKATIAYYQAVLINPHHSWSYHNLGDTHLKLGNWQEAITTYQKAIKLNPDYFWSNYSLGVAYSNSKQWRLAVKLYRRSIKLNPGLNLPFFALKETLK